MQTFSREFEVSDEIVFVNLFSNILFFNTGRAIVYPNDPDLVVNQYRNIEWRHYKDELMQDISTNRWPKKFDTHEPFTI